MQLTDYMIEKALQETSYMNESLWLPICICGGVLLVIVALAFLYLKVGIRTEGIIGVVFAVVFLIMSVRYIINQNRIKASIINGEWEVVTDRIEEVTQTTKDGNTKYHVILEKYESISLDDYNEATKYHSGETVYVVVVPKGNKYESTGIVYNANEYTYVGNH